MWKRILCVAFVVLFGLALVACASEDSGQTGSETNPTDSTADSSADSAANDASGEEDTSASGNIGDANKEDTASSEKETVVITMEGGSAIEVELDPVQAPVTVANFLKLVDEGFYDGLTFHRIIPGFMIQGGDPEGTGMGGASEQIKGEFASNGVDNTISHVRGVISMARSSDPDSASSQFFITNADSPHLDGDYAAFGTVVSGMEVVDEISAVTTDANDAPTTPVVIESIKRK